MKQVSLLNGGCDGGYLQVAVTNTPELLTYAVPERLAAMIIPGARVRVPIRRRTAVGMAVAFTQTPPQSVALRDVHSVLDVVPLLPPDLLRLGTEIARGYVCSPSASLEALIPGGFKLKCPACLFLSASPAQAPQLLLDGLTLASRTLYQQIAHVGRIVVPEMESIADYTPYAILIDSGLVELIPFCDPPDNALARLQLLAVEGQSIRDFPELPPEGISAEELQTRGVSRDRLSRYLAQGKLWARPVPRTCETRHHRTSTYPHHRSGAGAGSRTNNAESLSCCTVSLRRARRRSICAWRRRCWRRVRQ